MDRTGSSDAGDTVATSLVRYGVAVLCSLAALVPWLAFGSTIEPSPFPLFVAAVAVSSWYGGLGAGLLTAFFGAVSIALFYFSPTLSLALGSLQNGIQLAVFILVTVLITWLNAERKRAQESMSILYRLAQQAASERSAVLEQMADGVIICNPAGTVTFFNDAALKIVGKQELEDGHSFHSLAQAFELSTLNGQPLTLERLPLARALRGETVIGEQWRIRRADGSEAIIQGSSRPVLGEGSEIQGAVTTFRDVTVERMLTQEKEDFLAAAAHDLKTPLTIVKGLAQLIERRGAEDPQRVFPLARRIEDTVDRMTNLVNNLLDIAHFRMDRPLELEREQVDLVALARQVAEEAQGTSEKHRIQVEAAEPELIGIWDGTRLARMLENLLSNAVKYSPDGGEVTVEVRREGNPGHVVIAVRDHGMGIPAGEVQRIFDRFYRAENVTGRIPGKGIGLTGVQQVVQQHEGEITVDSVEGDGTTFTVRLPLDASRPEQPSRM